MNEHSILNQPLWLNRHKCIKANRLLERLEKHLNKESIDDFSFIANHVLKLSNQESEPNVLDDVSRQKLENILGSNLSNYALSMLLSFFVLGIASLMENHTRKNFISKISLFF